MSIEAIKPTLVTKQRFIVADIENRRDGSLLGIFTAYRWCDEIKYEYHESWADWFDRILELSRKEKRFRTVYAHNGGGWDWLHLLEHLLKDDRYRFWKIEGQRVQSKIVVLRVHVQRKDGDKKVTRFCMRFADSLYLLRSKLDTLAKKFLGEGKISLGEKLPEDIYGTPQYFEYGNRDVGALLEILEKTLQLLRDKIAPIDSLGLTIGSTALKVWRTGFLTRTVTIPFMKSVKEFLREGYRGGRVEVFKHGIFDNVNVYDINSLYPTAMVRTKVPVSDRGDWTDIFRWNLPSVYRIQFTQRNRALPPVLLANGSGSYSGEGTYFIPEIALLREIDPHAEIKIKKGYCFYEADYLFSDYVSALYGLRQTDSGGPVDLLAKYLLNSLYGKLAQRGEREQYLIFSDIREASQAIKDGRDMIELNLALGTWAETTKSDVKFEHVGIAGMITSVARVNLYRGLLSAGTDRVIYCDTDSVHTTGKLSPELIGNELGQFKLEFSGSGAYAGRKLYALRSLEGKEKVRAKGVSVGGRNGAFLDYAGLCRIVGGEAIQYTYFQPTTANEVMHGKTACVFRKRTRTLRNTGI